MGDRFPSSGERDLGRLAADWAPFCLTLIAVSDRGVGRCEGAAFQEVNRLPDIWHGPLWGVMQLGTLGAPLVLGGLGTLAGRPVLGRRLAGSGVLAYLAAKGVKRVVRRGRPAELVPTLRVRGRPATGGGFVSGHAAVSMALAAEVCTEAPAPARALPLLGAALVSLARVYVGAHLPLDVVGGAALGWAIARTRVSWQQGWSASPPLARAPAGAGPAT